MYTFETLMPLMMMFHLMFFIQVFAAMYFKTNLPMKLLPLVIIIMVPLDWANEHNAQNVYDVLQAVLDSLRYTVPMVVAYVYGWYVGISLRDNCIRVLEEYRDPEDDDYDDPDGDYE